MKSLTEDNSKYSILHRELTNHEADWSREFRNVSMFTSQHLRNWVVIVPQCKHREAEDFIDILQRAGIGMRYEIARPTM